MKKSLNNINLQEQKFCAKHNEILVITNEMDIFEPGKESQFEKCQGCAEEMKEGCEKILKISYKTITMMCKFLREIQKSKFIKTQVQEQLIEFIYNYITNIKSAKYQFQQLISLNYNYQLTNFLDTENFQKLQRLNQEAINELNRWLQEEQKNYNLDHLFKIIYDCNDNNDETYNKKISSKQLMRQVIYQEKACYSFAFDKKNTILFVGADQGNVFLYGLNSQNKLIKKQTLSHNEVINNLILAKDNSLLVSGSWDKSIIILNNESKQQQILQGCQGCILCMVLNEDENLLISAGENQYIKFWKKINLRWSFLQALDTSQSVISNLSLNPKQNKLISQGELEIMVIEHQKDQEWKIVQKIQTDLGSVIYFINNNSFIFQPYGQGYLEIFKYESEVGQFIRSNNLLFSYNLNEYESFYYFVKDTNLLIVKNLYCFISFHLNEYDDFILQDEFKVDEHQNDRQISGTFSQDGQYLVACDCRKQKILVIKSRKQL